MVKKNRIIVFFISCLDWYDVDKYKFSNKLFSEISFILNYSNLTFLQKSSQTLLWDQLFNCYGAMT